MWTMHCALFPHQRSASFPLAGARAVSTFSTCLCCVGAIKQFFFRYISKNAYFCIAKSI